MRNPLAHIPTGRAAAAMANGLPVVYPNTLSTTPRGGDSRPSLFLRLIAWLLIATISTSSFAQAVGPILRGANGQPLTGFAKNGTFMQAGQVVGNPHQIQHDQQNPDLWSTGAVALSHDNAVQPLYVQPTVDQMMATIAPPVDPGGLYLSRLYLNPTNPYVAGAGPLSYPPSPTPETGSAAPTSGPLIDNFEQYRRAYVHALAQITGGNVGGGWKETLPSDAGVVYLAKSHVDSSPELKNFAWDAFPNKPVFQAAEDPKGGATAVFAIQGSLAKTHLANLQLQNASLLGSQIFFTQQTIKTPTNWSPGNEWGSGGSGSGGGDWGSNSALSAFEAQLGSAPLSGNSNHGNNSYGGALHNANGFEIGYIQTDGQAHAFDITSDQHFRQFQSSASSGTGNNNSLLGANLRTAGIQNQKGQDAIANIGFDWAKDDKALFYQGVNLYNYGNKADNALLRQLELGQITPGSTDYARARALAEQRFTQAYQASVEYELKKKFTKEGAKYQAAQLSFDDFDAGKLFNSGLNLFDKKGDPEQERLLGELKAGNLKPGDARYAEIRGLAEARYRVAYQKALEPPKKPNPLKQLVAVVVAAVVTYFTAGAATGWAATALGTTAGATTVSGIAATAIGSAVGSYAGTVISAGIQTGSMSKALAAGENSLKGGLANIVVSTALAATGLNGGNIGTALGMSDKVGQAVLNTMTTSLSQTMAYGGSLGDTLINSAINNGVNVISADIANQIGQANLNGLDGFSTEFAHGALGCASAVARGGNSDSCGAGAVGAVVAHAGGSYVDQSTGRVLSDSELSFYASLGGGIASALVGGSNNVQANFYTGQQSGQNAVDNNLLTLRNTAKALDRIRQCTEGCDELKRQLGVNEVDGGRQKKVEDIKYQCSTRPGECTALMQDMVKTVDLLRSPETRALLGEEGVNALVQRQIADVGKVAAAIRTGWDNETRAKAMAPVLAQLAVDMSPLGTPESIAQLITGRESVSGEEASRLWAALGVIPLGGVIRRVGEPLTDVLSAAARKLPNALGEINLADDAFKTLKNVAPTPSGLINKTKLGEAAVIKTATIDQRLIISDVVANGDKLGVKTEALVNDVLKADPNFKILDAKYRGNNGLDHLVQYTDAQTGKTMTMVIDSKQLAKNGTTKLDPEAAGGVMQLSDSSLDAIVNALGGSPAAMALDAAMSSGTLVKAVAYVDKVTGELKIVRVDVPNPKR